MQSLSNIVIIAHNLRSTHNVGSLLRTAEGLGVSHVWLTGYTPYPKAGNDSRLPHLAQKIDKQIAKTALGAETMLDWHQSDNVFEVIDSLKKDGYAIAALEQDNRSISLVDYRPPKKIALIVGREVEGIEADVLETCQVILKIPMFGKKESYNVVQAAAMALFHLRFN